MSKIAELPPTRSRFQTAIAVIGMLALGVLSGNGLVHWLSPSSGLARFVGFTAFPLIFGGGYKMWQAEIVVIALRGLGCRRLGLLVKSLLFGRRVGLRASLPSPEEAGMMIRQTYKRTGGFFFAGLFIGVAAGLVVGFVSEPGFITAVSSFAVAGSAYGFALRRLASEGYLPPPEQ